MANADFSFSTYLLMNNKPGRLKTLKRKFQKCIFNAKSLQKTNALKLRCPWLHRVRNHNVTHRVSWDATQPVPRAHTGCFRRANQRRQKCRLVSIWRSKI